MTAKGPVEPAVLQSIEVLAMRRLSRILSTRQITTLLMTVPLLLANAAATAQDDEVLTNVPHYVTSEGTAPGAAGMMMGYFDRNGLPDMVEGIAELSTGPNATAAIEALAALMGADGSACLWNYKDTGEPWTPLDAEEAGEDGCDATWGIDTYVTQQNPAYGPNQTQHRLISELVSGGMTLADFKAFIDAGLPTLVNVDTDPDPDVDSFTTLLAYGYSGTTSGTTLLYLRDPTTLDGTQTMEWGGTYDNDSSPGDEGTHASVLTVEPKIPGPVFPDDWTTAYSAMQIEPSTVTNLRGYRDRVLQRSARGRLYTKVLYAQSDRALQALQRNQALREQAQSIVAEHIHGVEDILAGGTGVITDAQVLIDFLDDYAREATWQHRLLAAALKWELRKARRSGEPVLGFEVR
jgi:hypothetical protein